MRLGWGWLSYYYCSHEDASPRYILTLRQSAVRDDGYKLNKIFQKNLSSNDVAVQTPNEFYHIISVYQRHRKSSVQETTDNNDEEIFLLIRVSTNSYVEKTQWVYPFQKLPRTVIPTSLNKTKTMNLLQQS